MDVRRHANDSGMAEMPHPVQHRQAADGSSGMLSKVLAWLLIVVSVVALGWFLTKGYGAVTANSSVKGKQFQALFLTNGQVYFGKLSQLNGQDVKLTNIYYLQVQQTVQPKDQSASSNNQQVSLAKLGGELHGPEDVMYVNRDQVLFWENLKDNGKVVTAIKNYQSGGK
jgi:hypothetical protein